jgi:thiol-disulfide isomerase/thioredoxin
MKKIFTTMLVACSMATAQAQLADGSTAPNFTFNDLNGNSQDLYSILNDGKYVLIDISATWCGPCWYMHNTLKTLEKVHEAHGAAGDNTARVLFLEGDISTTLADLQGTTSGTQGDWLTGTSYPVMNPTSSPQSGETSYSQFDAGYQIGFYPTFFVICPNKKVWQDTLNASSAPWPTLATIEYINTAKCGVAPAGLDDIADAKPVTFYPNPASSTTNIYFGLKNTANVKLEVLNTVGQTVAIQNYGTLNAGDQTLKFDVSNLAAGNYNFKISANDRVFNKSVLVAH